MHFYIVLQIELELNQCFILSTHRYFLIFCILHQHLSFITSSTSCLSIQYIITKKLTTCIHKKIKILNEFKLMMFLFFENIIKLTKNRLKSRFVPSPKHDIHIDINTSRLFLNQFSRIHETLMLLEMNEIIFSLKNNTQHQS